MPPRPVYLDHAATTPVRSEVREAMLPFLGDELFGNPSSGHQFGRAVRAAVEDARREVASALGVPAGQVFFTSGGTEGDNLAILGPVGRARDTGRPMHAAVSCTEHKAILAAAHEVSHMGGREILLPVEPDGLLDLQALDQVLQDRPAVVSVMWVNNETGVIQPIGEIARRCRAAGVCFHTDLVQAFGKVPVSLTDVDLATISAHKVGGPKGVGAIFARDPSLLLPRQHGGGQQGGVRPGTENVAGIIGFARAATLAVAEQAAEEEQLARLRDLLLTGLRAALPDVLVTGDGAPLAPHILNIQIPGAEADSLLTQLDLAGIAASSGSACTTGSIEPSHVLSAMGVSRDLALSAIRLSLGHESSSADIDRVLEVMPRIVEKSRRLAQALGRGG